MVIIKWIKNKSIKTLSLKGQLFWTSIFRFFFSFDVQICQVITAIYLSPIYCWKNNNLRDLLQAKTIHMITFVNTSFQTKLENYNRLLMQLKYILPPLLPFNFKIVCYYWKSERIPAQLFQCFPLGRKVGVSDERNIHFFTLYFFVLLEILITRMYSWTIL